MEAIELGRRASDDWFVVKVALNVSRQVVGRRVTARSVFLQRLHNNPIEIATQQCAEPGRFRMSMLRNGGEVGIEHRAQSSGRTRRLLLADGAAHRVQSGGH